MPRLVSSEIPFVSLEGPYWVSNGGYLIFSDVVEGNQKGATIYRYDPETSSRPGRFSIVPYPVAPTSTNGLAMDPRGRLLACERWNGAVTRIEGNSRTVLAAELGAPNDLAVRSDGNIYFSDTRWGARPSSTAQTAVYRIAPSGETSIVFSVEMPNGVALSPKGTELYVGSDSQDKVWQLPVAQDGSVGPALLFTESDRLPRGTLHVPDGMCVDEQGRVYVANNSKDVSGISVFAATGTWLFNVKLPEPPSNCTFGGADGRTMYITTLHGLYELRVDTPGLP
ncbi:MAG TPA: SMP-30/gluconolactonase/LRE family protein [Polyangiaceae bacterium]